MNWRRSRDRDNRDLTLSYHRRPCPSILVVEDDADIAELIAHYLEKAGHRVERLTSGSDVLPQLREGAGGSRHPRSHAAGHGRPASSARRCAPIRRPPRIPIIMLTARGEEADRISGPRARRRRLRHQAVQPEGADARASRRSSAALAAADDRRPPRYGPITIDADRHQVTLDGEEVRLTAKEFLLLQYLVQHRGRVLSRDLLLSDVWGYHYTGGTRTVDVHIRRLREKLPVLADAIETIKQFGYKLADRP